MSKKVDPGDQEKDGVTTIIQEEDQNGVTPEHESDSSENVQIESEDEPDQPQPSEGIFNRNKPGFKTKPKKF